MDPFQRLASQLVTNILQYLDKENLATCRLINKTLNHHTNPLYWQEISEYDHPNALSELVSISGSFGEYIRHATLYEFLSNDTILAFVKQVPFLETLDLNRYLLPIVEPQQEQEQEQILQSCLQLQSLRITIEDGGNSVPQFFTNGLEQHTHQQLTHIDLYQCHSSSARSLFSALSTCPLSSLRFAFCEFEDMYDNPQWVESAALDLAKVGSLKTLELKDKRSIDYTPFFMTTTSNYNPVWPELIDLSLHPCPTLEDQKVIPFLQAHPKLQQFKLHASQITDDTLDAMKYLPEITLIHLYQNQLFNADKIEQLVKLSSSTLTNFKLHGCGFVLSDFSDTYKCECYVEQEYCVLDIDYGVGIRLVKDPDPPTGYPKNGHY